MLQSLLRTTERVVQQVDSVEYGLTDIQEYYANTGALVAAANAAKEDQGGGDGGRDNGGGYFLCFVSPPPPPKLSFH